MISFLVIAVAIGVAAADVSSLGYQYKVPQTSYGIPSYQVGSNNYNTGYTQNAGSSGSGYNYKGQSAQVGYHGLNAGQSNNAYQGTHGYQYQGSSSGGSGYVSAPSVSHSGYQGLSTGNQGYTGYQGGSSGASFVGSGSGQFYSPSISSTSSSLGSDSLVQPTYQVSSGASSGQSAYQYQSQYQTGHQQKYEYQFQQQPAQVFKHFYVHAAPEEPELVKPRNPILLPPPQKHYKIIFIKTPTQAGSSSQIFPVQQQNEEKTIVYVLVNKQEDYHDIAVPKIEQKPPSKPEVYFIKYKNKEESQAVINNIVSDYSKGHNSVSFSGAGADAVQSGSSSFAGQINSGTVGLASGVSYQGQSDAASSGSSSTSGYVSHGQVDSGSSLGSYSEQGQLIAGQSFGPGTESHVATGFSSTFGSSSATPGATLSPGYDAFGSSSTVTYDNINTISTSQGVPHETYGVPKFKEH